MQPVIQPHGGRVLRILIMVLLVACSTKDIESEAGWRGVPLNAAPSEVADLVLVRQDPTGDGIYERTNEDPRWGKARIAVRYHFWEDALWKVEVRTGDSMALLDAIKADYGTPPFSRPWTWDGEKVRMHFKGNEHDSAALVTIVSKGLETRREAAVAAQREIEAARSAKAVEAAKAAKAEREAAKAEREAAKAAEAVDAQGEEPAAP